MPKEYSSHLRGDLPAYGRHPCRCPNIEFKTFSPHLEMDCFAPHLLMNMGWNYPTWTVSIPMGCIPGKVDIIHTNELHPITWWRHQMETFSALLAFVRGIHRSPVNSSHKGQWRGALMFSFICAWINGWVNNREAGDLRRHRAHYDVVVMNMNRIRPYPWAASRKIWTHESMD